MVTRHERGGVTWIDLESPSETELRAVMKEFDIDARVEEEIISPTPYPLVATFEDYAYLILHFPTADPKMGTRNQEVDIIMGKHFLITARYEVVSCIQSLHKAFEAETLLGTPTKESDPSLLMERVLRHLYSSMRVELEQVARTLDKIERDIFSGKERAMVRSISEMGRVLLRFETTLARHQEPLSTFLETMQTTNLLGKKLAASAVHIEGERAHVAALVASYRDVARELRNTNDSLLSTAQNDVMRIFTIITVAFLPLTLIAGIFGMHTEFEPITGMPYDFYVILFIMAILEVLLLLFLSVKRWI
jgi:magnesium transporter